MNHQKTFVNSNINLTKFQDISVHTIKFTGKYAEVSHKKLFLLYIIWYETNKNSISSLGRKTYIIN